MSKSWKRERRERILREVPVHEQLEALCDEVGELRKAMEGNGVTVIEPETMKILREKTAAVRVAIPKPV